jgi:predicted PhzF superfamily epimerase YddE/YHI9
MNCCRRKPDLPPVPRYGIAKPEQTVHIQQGVEIKLPSDIFVRAGRDGEKVGNVRVRGHTVVIMEGEVSL